MRLVQSGLDCHRAPIALREQLAQTFIGMMKTANTTASRCMAGPHASSSTKPII